MKRREFLVIVPACAAAACLPAMSAAANTPADHVRNLVGDLLPQCEFKDGPQEKYDSFGNEYKQYGIGAGPMVPYEEREYMLRKHMRAAITGAAGHAKICQVRAFHIIDKLKSDQMELHVRLSFWPAT